MMRTISLPATVIMLSLLAGTASAQVVILQPAWVPLPATAPQMYLSPVVPVQVTGPKTTIERYYFTPAPAGNGQPPSNSTQDADASSRLLPTIRSVAPERGEVIIREYFVMDRVATADLRRSEETAPKKLRAPEWKEDFNAPDEPDMSSEPSTSDGSTPVEKEPASDQSPKSPVEESSDLPSEIPPTDPAPAAEAPGPKA